MIISIVLSSSVIKIKTNAEATVNFLIIIFK